MADQDLKCCWYGGRGGGTAAVADDSMTPIVYLQPGAANQHGPSVSATQTFYPLQLNTYGIAAHDSSRVFAMSRRVRTSSGFELAPPSRNRAYSDLEKEALGLSDPAEDEYDEEDSPSSYSSRATSSSYQPMLGNAYSQRAIGRLPVRTGQAVMRWLCWAVAATILVFMFSLAHLSWSSGKRVQIELGKSSPPPSAPWEAFPFLERYYGGVRSLVSRSLNVPEYPSSDQTSSGTTREHTRPGDITPEAFNPYPDYMSDAYKNQYGIKVDCYLDKENKIQIPPVRIYHGVPSGFPDPVMGTNSLLGMRNDICYDRFGRLGPYGLGYSLNRGGTGAALEGDRDGADRVWEEVPEVDYRAVQWVEAQQTCTMANKDRFAEIKSSGTERFRSMQVGRLAGREEGREDSVQQAPDESLPSGGPSLQPDRITKLPRTAVVIRTWWDYPFTTEDVLYLRSIIAELSLNSGGEYTIHFLIQVRDDNAPIWSDNETYERVLRDALPEEFWGMGTLWSERQMGLVYGGLAESFTRGLPVHGVYRSAHMPLQYFAYTHPEYDFIWNWEMDVRYTGHWYHLFDSVSKWAKAQPRKGLWERNSRFYIPSEHGSWEDFRQMVRVQTQLGTNSPNNIWSGLHTHTGTGSTSSTGTGTDKREGDIPIWGPEPPLDDANTTFPTDPVPPTTYDADKSTWGVGEEADLITFNPLFDPSGTTWLLADDITGYNTTRSPPPRRAAIITASASPAAC
ncbi:hypothetical protein GJ744_009740 [Endocarpon pusillum]|uniref:Uncharacterized protein n=1 Tax=Endocarpon pusillum TaxID=364733 RepID=A0A8H7ATM4_9EURO|nr:hypothetical protein GJ744_009740 [Endocarpon pusillum]